LPAVGKHHREEDEQEGQIEDEGDGGAGNELADGFDPVQAGNQGAGGALFEVRQRQPQQVRKTLLPSTASMRLPVCSTRYWRSQVMPLVNSMNMTSAMPSTMRVLWVWWTTTLSMITWVKSGRGQANELDGEAGDENVAPDGFVFEEFGDEPLEPLR
jgi:hypothetical protein